MDSTQTESPKFVTQDEARTRWLKSLEARDHRRYFKSGFKAHEQSIGAFLRGSFNLFAARPGVGKTAFLFALAYRQVLAGVKAISAISKWVSSKCGIGWHVCMMSH